MMRTAKWAGGLVALSLVAALLYGVAANSLLLVGATMALLVIVAIAALFTAIGALWTERNMRAGARIALDAQSEMTQQIASDDKRDVELIKAMSNAAQGGARASLQAAQAAQKQGLPLLPDGAGRIPFKALNDGLSDD